VKGSEKPKKQGKKVPQRSLKEKRAAKHAAEAEKKRGGI
jgi:hypothetical protein